MAIVWSTILVTAVFRARVPVGSIKAPGRCSIIDRIRTATAVASVLNVSRRVLVRVRLQGRVAVAIGVSTGANRDRIALKNTLALETGRIHSVIRRKVPGKAKGNQGSVLAGHGFRDLQALGSVFSVIDPDRTSIAAIMVYYCIPRLRPFASLTETCDRS